MRQSTEPPLTVSNTLTGKKEIFHPLRKDWVGLYTCGPTVYNFVHIGNLRTYIFQDVLKRTLACAGYRVRHIMNLTDVDDKTVRGAHASGKTLRTFTREYERAFKEDLKKLNMVPPERFTRATEHIPDMIRLIFLLIKKGFAYEKNGSVYFNISQFKPYGKLAHLDRKGLKTGARVDVDEYQKNEAQDFVLWKAKKAGEPSWQADFAHGRLARAQSARDKARPGILPGRPGWHIECSAMSTKYLGQPFDLHTAAVDLIFPHHENEIAQSEAASGKKFVHYWVHGEHLLVNGQKMSKSLGNIFTLRDLEKKHVNPLAFRYLILTSHYRSKLNFTWESLAAAQNSLNRLYEFMARLKTDVYRGSTSIDSIERFRKNFSQALRNDLDTPRALAGMWRLIHEYRKTPTRFHIRHVTAFLMECDSVLGLSLKAVKVRKIPPAITTLVEQREVFRKRKLWKEADRMRIEIKKRGYAVEDTPRGPAIKPQ